MFNRGFGLYADAPVQTLHFRKEGFHAPHHPWHCGAYGDEGGLPPENGGESPEHPPGYASLLSRALFREFAFVTAGHRIERLVTGIELLSPGAEQSERPGGIESGHHHVVVSKCIAGPVTAKMADIKRLIPPWRFRQRGFRRFVHVI